MNILVGITLESAVNADLLDYNIVLLDQVVGGRHARF